MSDHYYYHHYHHHFRSIFHICMKECNIWILSLVYLSQHDDLQFLAYNIISFLSLAK
jgi:hypothetical protein